LPTRKISFDTVRKIGLELPGVEDSTTHGALALKVRGALMACIATNKSAEPDSLMVRVDFDRRAELIEGAPDVYYVTDHYLNYPSVLVRLSRIDSDALRDVLGMAWRFVTAKKLSGSGPVRKTKTARKPR
jgi:hypothetical protein